MSPENKILTVPAIIMNFTKVDKSIPSPKYAIEGDACIDLVAYKIISETDIQIVYDTGIAVEIPVDKHSVHSSPP